MVVCRAMTGHRNDTPSATPGLARVKSMKILGVPITELLNFDSHVSNICIRARQSMYAIRVLAG